jgi:hypothetical protein
MGSAKRKNPMNLGHTAALALVVWCLTMPSALRADGSIAVPGTADVETGISWYLMQPPYRPLPAPPGWPPGTHPAEADITAPFSEWTKIKTFPTEKKCQQGAGDALAEYQSKQEGKALARLSAQLGVRVFSGRGDIRSLAEEKTLRCVASDDPRLKK